MGSNTAAAQGARRIDRHSVLALAIILVAISLFHWRGLLPGQTFLPVDLANNLLPWRQGPSQELQNSLITDPLFEFYPYLDFAVDSLRESGEWPLWNPNAFLGYPVIADPNFQAFYPFYLISGLLLGAARALAIVPWLHALLAAFFVFAYTRTMRSGRTAAVLVALTYALSGHMVVWFAARQWSSTIAWLPGVLWAYELWMARRKPGYLALAGLLFGCTLLSGQLQIVLAFALFFGLYAIVRTLEEGRLRSALSLWPLAAAAIVVLLGFLLGAIQILPFIEYLAFSQRGPATLVSSVRPEQLLTLIIPDFFGNPATIGDYWGQSNYSERTIYVGLAALLLTVVALFAVRRRRLFVAGMTAITLATAYLSVSGPGVELLVSIPVLNMLALSRLTFVFTLVSVLILPILLDEGEISPLLVVAVSLFLAGIVALAFIGNIGTAQEHWEELSEPVLRAALILMAATLLLLLRSRLPRARRWLEAGLVLLVFVDLFLYGSRFNPAGPIADLLPPNDATAYLQENVGEHRVAPLMPGWNLAYGPNILSTFEIAEPGGYSSVVPERLRQLFVAGDPAGRHWNILALNDPSRRLLDLFQVIYVASPSPLEDSEMRLEVQRVGCAGATDEIAAGTAASGMFVVRDSAINRLDLQFARLGEGPEGATLLIRLWQGEGRDRLALEARQPVADLADRQQVTWYFAPEETAPGRAYTWEVSAAEDQPNTGVALCLAEDGQPVIAVYGENWYQDFDQGIFYHRRTAPMPRAYVVYAAESIATDQEAVRRLLDEAFDLRNSAVVAEPIELPTIPELAATRARIVDYKPTRVVLEAEAAGQGLLILGDQYHPGWRATIDGRPARIVRANHVMRGVLLAPGSHQVEFRFEPSSLRSGGLLSLAAAVVLILLAVAGRFNWSRSKRDQDVS